MTPRKTLPLAPTLFILLVPHIPYLFKGIDSPHTWRQADTAAVARNFHQESWNIFLPRIDTRGDKTGITGMEFPLYSFTVALLSVLFQTDNDFVGLMVSLISSIFLFFALERLFPTLGRESLLLSFFATPVFFQWAHRFMPAMFALALCLWGVYFYNSPNKKWLLPATLLLLSGSLVRPFFIFFYLPLLLHVLRSLWGRQIPWPSLAAGTLSLGIIFSWYYLWCPHLVDTYGIKYFALFQDFSLSNLTVFFDPSLYVKLAETLIHSYISPLLIGFSFLGLRSLDKDSFFWATLMPLVFIPLITGPHFHIHPYYLMGLSPLIVISTAYGLEWAQKNWRYPLLVGLVASVLSSGLFGEQGKLSPSALTLPLISFLLLLARQYSLRLPLYREKEPYCLGVMALLITLVSWQLDLGPRNHVVRGARLIAPEVSERTAPDSLIITNDPSYSVALFVVKRKGFRVRKKLSKKDLARYRERGAEWSLLYDEKKRRFELSRLD